MTLSQLQSIAASVLGAEPASLDPDAPLASLGLTSTLAVQLMPALEQALGMDLPATLPYDRPTLAEMLRYVQQSPTVPQVAMPPPVHATAVYVLGSAARLPGSRVADDAVSPVPLCRWDVDTETPDARFGGILGGAEVWDPALYGITAGEALHMDPQQRLVLDVVAQATGGRVNASCGVYVGVSQVRSVLQPPTRVLHPAQLEYARICHEARQSASAYHATGAHLSVTAGRVSFVLGLRGPAMAIDTGTHRLAPFEATNITQHALRRWWRRTWRWAAWRAAGRRRPWLLASTSHWWHRGRRRANTRACLLQTDGLRC